MTIEKASNTTENLEAEKEEYTSRIELKFFRHGDKEKDPKKDDYDIRLSEKGESQSINKSDEVLNKKLAVSFGSSRIRSQETAALVMDGRDELIGIDDWNKFKEEVGVGLLGQPKIIQDDRLNFELDTNTATGRAGKDAYIEKRYLDFFIKESDELSKKNNDLNENSTYSECASNIASIVKDYVNGSNRWEQIIKAEETRKFPKGYEKDLERFFGSHQGVTESFLNKIIEKTKG